MRGTKNLLTIGDAKTSKGEKLGYKTAILYLSPHKQNSKGKNLCAFASKGCATACLFTAGRGKFSNVKLARIKKTEYFLSDRYNFLGDLIRQIDKLSSKFGDQLVIRLNGTSDIPFEDLKFNDYSIFEHFPHIQFYDYTKNPRRALMNKNPNYHLTFSRSEDTNNNTWAKSLLNDGFNVAAVYNKDLYSKVVEQGFINIDGKTYNVVDGDLSDLRFLDKQGSIIALKAKGDANKDQTNFVIQSINQF